MAKYKDEDSLRKKIEELKEDILYKQNKLEHLEKKLHKLLIKQGKQPAEPSSAEKLVKPSDFMKDARKGEFLTLSNTGKGVHFPTNVTKASSEPQSEPSPVQTVAGKDSSNPLMDTGYPKTRLTQQGVVPATIEVSKPQAQKLIPITGPTKTYYTIFNGPNRGGYSSWPIVSSLVTGKPFTHQSFKTEKEALSALNEYQERAQAPKAQKAQTETKPSFIEIVSAKSKKQSLNRLLRTKPDPTPKELKEQFTCFLSAQQFIHYFHMAEVQDKNEELGFFTINKKSISLFGILQGAQPEFVRDLLNCGLISVIYPSNNLMEISLFPKGIFESIRFDPSATVCSFIQSRGRARMQNSDFVLMVKSGDHSAVARVNNYLASGNIMRKECLSHANLPCEPLDNEMYGEPWYEVKSTGAIVTLSSSVALLHFYCSRLPSDRYFKPYPLCTINKELRTCTLHLPNSCPIRTVTVTRDTKSLKQLACLEACKKLHEVCALTDYLVPDIVEEEAKDQTYGSEPYLGEHARYFPRELVGFCANESNTHYQCYLIEMQQSFTYDVKPQSILLAVRERLDDELDALNFDLDADKGKIIVNIKDVGHVTLSPEQVAVSRKFQVTLLQIMLKHNLDKPDEDDQRSGKSNSTVIDYLLLPCLVSSDEISVDWKCICSFLYQKNASSDRHTECCRRNYAHSIHTKDGLVCYCMLENSLICTPHNGVMYCIRGALEGVNGNTKFSPRYGDNISYKKYYKQRHGIDLQFEWQTLLFGKHIFTVHNYLQRCRTPSLKEPSNSSCELPPELCSIIMSPISISSIYSLSFIPSIMHRIESLLIASNLRSVPLGHSGQNVVIPTLKVLEAITTKKCQEKLHLESLETLGDSFLKYAASRQLFKTYQNEHEGLLSLKRERIIRNAALCKLGCDRQIPGFIRNEPFDLKTWLIPGKDYAHHVLEEELSSNKKVYIRGSRNIKSKTVADVIEALIGAYLSAGSEIAALSFMKWLGIIVDFDPVPYANTFIARPDDYINVRSLESLLKYTFRDASILVEALTHGSYMRPEIPRCYQRLEFLGDAVLDYLITLHHYHKYHGLLTPGLLTDLRSASVNNDCYAQSAIRAGLHKYILHLSSELQKHIGSILSNVEGLQSVETFSWESEISLPKVLGDVIESIAGAIYVDSGCDKERVFQSMKPLLEPLVTLKTLKLHPKRELHQLCQSKGYDLKKPIVTREKGVAYVTVEVKANGFLHKATRSASDRKMAEKIACKVVLNSLKDRISAGQNGSLI